MTAISTLSAREEEAVGAFNTVATVTDYCAPGKICTSSRNYRLCNTGGNDP